MNETNETEGDEFTGRSDKRTFTTAKTMKAGFAPTKAATGETEHSNQ